MKVNEKHYSSVQGSELNPSHKSHPKKDPIKTGTLQDVKMDISENSKDYLKIKSAALSAPDIREEKINDLKNKIQEGRYSVPPELVADRLVNEHLEF